MRSNSTGTDTSSGTGAEKFDVWCHYVLCSLSLVSGPHIGMDRINWEAVQSVSLSFVRQIGHANLRYHQSKQPVTLGKILSGVNQLVNRKQT